jgi:hypothetical protein
VHQQRKLSWSVAVVAARGPGTSAAAGFTQGLL